MLNKKLLIIVSLFSLVSVAGGWGWAQSAVRNPEPRLIPLTDFFKNPLMTNVTLSPDGKHIAFMSALAAPPQRVCPPGGRK